MPEPWSELLLNCKPEKSLLSFQNSQMTIHEQPLDMQHKRLLKFDTIDQGISETVRENENCPHCQGNYHSPNCSQTSGRESQVLEIQTVAEQMPEQAMNSGNGLHRINAILATGNDKQKIKEAIYSESSTPTVAAGTDESQSDTKQRRNELIEILNMLVGRLQIDHIELAQNDDRGFDKCQLDLEIARNS